MRRGHNSARFSSLNRGQESQRCRKCCTRLREDRGTTHALIRCVCFSSPWSVHCEFDILRGVLFRCVVCLRREPSCWGDDRPEPGVDGVATVTSPGCHRTSTVSSSTKGFYGSTLHTVIPVPRLKTAKLTLKLILLNAEQK